MKIGNIIANKIYDDIRQLPIKRLPHLAIVQVGDDPASTIYIKYKRRACDKLGYKFTLFKYDDTISTDKLAQEIDKINKNSEITGCIIQLPLPLHINKFKILNVVDPRKDVDGFHIENVGRLALGIHDTTFVPATVLGIYKFIKYHNLKTKGKCCVIIGKSRIVGRPLQMLLSDEFDCAYTTILCDKYTENLDQITKMADILIVAAGVHHLINNPKYIKQDAVVIDVGIHRVKINNKFKVQGDVDYNKIKEKCKLITPVPGGVGPITVAALMLNLSEASKN